MTICYVSPIETYENRKEKLSYWGIYCDCNFCQNDIKTKDESYKKIYLDFIHFFQKYQYRKSISKDELSIIYGKILELNNFVEENKNKLTSFETCYCLLEVFKFYNFTNQILLSKQIFYKIFKYNNHENFLITIELLNMNLRFTNHLIDIK